MKIAFLFFFLFTFCSLFGQEIRNYTATTSENIKITVNGIFDEPEWQNATWQNQFVQYEPIEGEAPSKQTEFAILYDANTIYVGIRSFDNPDSISMRMSRRDDIEGDLVGIFIDSYFDKRTHFSFIVSAAGVRTDNINSNDGESEDDTWDPIWHTKTALTQHGWNAEMQIPLTQLRFEESIEQRWGLQVLRYIFRKDELSSWQAMKRDQTGFTSQFGTMDGIKNIEPQNTMNITPYVVARAESYEKEPENPFLSSGNEQDFNIGLDAKIGVTNYLTMDVTINPDFGQVEADPSEVNLSTYETFFDEKRPFFIEGKNILSYTLSAGDGDLAANNLFYSRRIGRSPQYKPDLEDDEYADIPDFTRIIGAAKITGKTKNGWSIGLLESVTSEENAKIKGTENEYTPSVEPLTNYFIARFQKDFNEGNTNVGAMLTSVNRKIDEEQLEFLHKSAVTGGIDFLHQWNNKKWSVQGGLYFSHVKGTEEAILTTQEAYSRTYQRPDADYITLDSSRTSLSGYGGKFALSKSSGRFKFGTLINWKSPGLEINDIGFSPDVDEILPIFWMGYRWYEPFSIFRNASVNFNHWTAFDFGGNLLVNGGNINGNAQFKNFWYSFANMSWEGENLSHSALRGGPSLKLPGNRRFSAGIFSNDQKKLRLGIDGSILISNEKDFSSRKNIDLSISYRPFRAIQIRISPEYKLSDYSLQYITQCDYDSNTRYIMSNIARKTLEISIRVSYNITPDLTIQYWGQPFIATGNYSGFKYITNSKASKVDDRYNLYTADQITYNPENELFLIDDNLDGTTDYSFDKPDFNVKEFLSNLVLRWEFRPGSMFYLVWSQNRSVFENIGKFKFNNDIDALFDEEPHNIFLVKFSYRIGR